MSIADANICQIFIDNLVRSNSGKFLNKSDVLSTFSHESKNAIKPGKMYYLVSKIANQQRYIYFDSVPTVFTRYVDDYDLLYANHDWSCLLETETIHKFCMDVDCGCPFCKNVPGHTKITPGDIENVIAKIIDFINSRFGVDIMVLRSSYIVTVGSSHGFHIIFNEFFVDHFSYVQILNCIVENVKTHCIIDVPYCFPIGYGRGHNKIKKFIDCQPTLEHVSFNELCPYVDVVAGLKFYHFDFNVSEVCPENCVKLSDIPVKRKVNDTVYRNPRVVQVEISHVNVDMSKLVLCSSPDKYYTECYSKFILPFSLAVHVTFSSQIQQFYNIQSPGVFQQTCDNITITDYVDTACNQLNVLPAIVYEKYITDGTEITNRTGPIFTEMLPEKCRKSPAEFEELDEENDDIADADNDYKPDPTQNYDMDPTNNFINIYNLNKYTDPRVYNGHIINRQYWTNILENYYEQHMKNKYSMALFGYATGIFDIDHKGITGPENIFSIRDYEHMTGLRGDEIMIMLIIYCMIYGRQVIGIISDLCATSEDYANKTKNKITDDSADLEFKDNIDVSPVDQIDSKNKSTWNQICASIIKYSWEFMEMYEARTGIKFPRKVLIIIKFLYIYNHNTDIAMKNMMSEFNCKHAMISNLVDSSVSKYMKSENLKFDHHRVYELLQILTGANAEESLNLIDFIVVYFWKPFEITGNVHIYNMKGYVSIIPEQFAAYVSENCEAKKNIKTKLLMRLVDISVPPFVQNHARQFIYNTNFENEQHGTYFRNTILGDFENTNGCVQTFLIRKYPNTYYLMGRFKPEIYNIIVDCWNGIQEIDYEIKMSGVKLLFIRPIVPPIFENIPHFREMFQHNTCALSVKDYRHVLSSCDINADRLSIMYSHYTDINPKRLTCPIHRIFYYTYMWFVELIVVLINSGLYENSNLNIDMIIPVLFGETSFEQLGIHGELDMESSVLSNCNETPDDDMNSLPVINFSNDRDEIDDKLPAIVFDYEQYINCSSVEYMLNVHQLKIDVPEFSKNDDDDDDYQIKKTGNDYLNNCTTLTELSVVNNRKNITKPAAQIINDKILKIKYNTIKIKTKKILSKIKSSPLIINTIISSGLIHGDDSWVDSENYKIYEKNLKMLSNHNRLLITIITLHALKRLYQPNCPGSEKVFVHLDIQKISSDRDMRLNIFKWFLDPKSLHNTIWRYDFFTGPRNFSREMTLYQYIMRHLEKFKHSAEMVKRGCSQFIEIISYSMMYTFIICENDFNKMIFLFRNLLNDEFPGQTIKKCLIVTGESDSGKTSFIENIYMQYINKSGAIVVPANNNRTNAPEKKSYSENFVLYQEDQTIIRSEFIKPFISKSKQQFRNNHGNVSSEVYPLPHLMLTNNDTKIIGADYATYNRIMVFSMNSIYRNCVNRFICEYLYLSDDDRCKLYGKCVKLYREVSHDKFVIVTDNLSLPYLFTNFHERQYITSELNIIKIIEGWQLITMYFSWYKFFKQINNPGAIYTHSLPQSMKDDYQKWLLVVSPYARWKKYIEIKKISSGDIGEVGMEWSIIQRNLEEFSKNVGTPSGDLCVMFKRDFNKYYNSSEDTYNVKVNEMKFKNIVKTKMRL